MFIACKFNHTCTAIDIFVIKAMWQFKESVILHLIVLLDLL